MKKLIKEMVYRGNAYLRLSKEDGDKVESDSIANQRDLIQSFLADKPDIQLVGERIDDGYSGATFDRPSFQKMVDDIKAGKINCVIVKDLSRFGRNFVEAGRYIDQVFPEYGVRFIAINDNFDSANGRSQSDNVLLPFLNLVNDAFCRDISIKVRSQLEIKRQKGDFIGSFAAYGYLKDPDDRHRLIVDDFAAAIVRDIFKWKIDGASQQRIADKLNELGALSPMEYKRSCGLQYRTGFQTNVKGIWTAVAVGRILRNEFYIGTLVQGKRTTPNHKVKKTIDKPREEWVCVANSHTPIVTHEEFATVGRLLLQDTRVAPNEETVSLFSGLIFCGDCGQNMVKNGVCQNGKTYSYYMCCQNRTTKTCSSHRIPEQLVKDSVLASLKQHIGNILQVEKTLAYIETLPFQKEEVQKADAQLIRKQEEIARYSQLKVTLYESLADGMVDKAEYLELKAMYDRKSQEAQTAEGKLKQELENVLQNRSQDALWITKFKRYQNLDEIDRRIAVTLIDKIVIYEGCRIAITFQYQYNFNRAVELIHSVSTAYPSALLPVKEAV